MPAPRRGDPGRRRRLAFAALAALVIAGAAVALPDGGHPAGEAVRDGRSPATGTGSGPGGGFAAVAVPDRPNGLALAGNTVWASTRAGTVGIPASRTLIERGRMATGGGRTIAHRGHALWVPIPVLNRVAQLDPRTGLPRDVAIHTAGRPRAIALAAGVVLVSQSGGESTWVQRYDSATGAERGHRIVVPDTTQRISLRGDVLWVLARRPDALLRYDVATGAPLTSTPVGEGATAMTAASGVVWVTGARDGSLTRVDERTLETARLRLGGVPQNVRVGLGAVWVTNTGRAALQRVDPVTGAVREIPVGQSPYSLVLDDAGVWVGDTADNVVRFVPRDA